MQEELLSFWEAGGRRMAVSFPEWGMLPDAGKFAAGSRSDDGTYFWHTAECETDGIGRIIRF
jgi:hypothetical protein